MELQWVSLYIVSVLSFKTFTDVTNMLCQTVFRGWPWFCNISEHTDSPNEVVLHGHTAPVVSCDWLCDGNQLVTGSWDHTAHLWDCETGQTIHTLQGEMLQYNFCM